MGSQHVVARSHAMESLYQDNAVMSPRIGLLTAIASLLVVVLICGTPIRGKAQSQGQWRDAPGHEQLLPESANGWEPALAVGPDGEVLVVAGKRTVASEGEGFEQRLVVWRSLDAGQSFEGPWPITTDGSHWDQRISIDRHNAVYVSYFDPSAGSDRLRLARSYDGGRTFTVDIIPGALVSDKPELAVSADGTHLYIVYESPAGPALIAALNDGGLRWDEPRVVVEGAGRHFWPEVLDLAPDGSIWFAVPSMSVADINARRKTPVDLHVLRSDDGARSWHDFDFGTSPRLVGECPHEQTCPGVKGPRVSLGVDDAGAVYVAYTEAQAPTEPYALFVRSTHDAGRTWSQARQISAAARRRTDDLADYDFPMVAASSDGQVCIVWVDDRRGALNVWTRCSNDGAESWGPEFILSDRADGAPYKSAAGFAAVYGHYGDAVIGPHGRLYAVWGAGERGYETGGVWFNSIDVKQATAR